MPGPCPTSFQTQQATINMTQKFEYNKLVNIFVVMSLFRISKVSSWLSSVYKFQMGELLCCLSLRKDTALVRIVFE